MKNWKTTTLGVLGLIVLVCGVAKSLLSGGSVDWTTTIAAVTAAGTGIFAKDHNVTGGDVKQ
jgi:hypothetical protein